MFINCEYKKSQIYKLGEILPEYSDYLNNGFFTADTDFTDFLDEIGLYRTNFNPLGLDFLGESDIPLAREIINGVFEREAENYCLEVKYGQTADYNAFMRKLVRVLDFTFPKYSTLYKFYQYN